MNRFPVLPVNGRHFEEWRSQAQAFRGTGRIRSRRHPDRRRRSRPIDLVRTSGGLLDVLQVRPAIGRPLRADDELGRSGCGRARHALWRERFGADASSSARDCPRRQPLHGGRRAAGTFQLPEAPKLGERCS